MDRLAGCGEKKYMAKPDTSDIQAPNLCLAIRLRHQRHTTLPPVVTKLPKTCEPCLSDT